MPKIWKDRIVLPSGEKIMPEQVDIVAEYYNYVQYRVSENQTNTFPLTGARIDRCTDCVDDNDTMVYDNDILSHREWGVGKVTYDGDSFLVGLWSDGGYGPLQGALSNGAVVIGMEPYSQEANDE